MSRRHQADRALDTDVADRGNFVGRCREAAYCPLDVRAYGQFFALWAPITPEHYPLHAAADAAGAVDLDEAAGLRPLHTARP